MPYERSRVHTHVEKCALPTVDTAERDWAVEVMPRGVYAVLAQNGDTIR